MNVFIRQAVTNAIGSNNNKILLNTKVQPFFFSFPFLLGHNYSQCPLIDFSLTSVILPSAIVKKERKKERKKYNLRVRLNRKEKEASDHLPPRYQGPPLFRSCLCAFSLAFYSDPISQKRRVPSLFAPRSTAPPAVTRL